MDTETLKTLYPLYTDGQIAAISAIYSEAAPIQDRINAMPEGFARFAAQQSFTRTLRMLSDNVSPE